MPNVQHHIITEMLSPRRALLGVRQGTDRTEECLNIFLEFVPGGSISSLLSKFGAPRTRAPIQSCHPETHGACQGVAAQAQETAA